ncbi:unnamed protein product [Notodromas monacha]|uniref:Alpha-1,3-glucosyltransferase n=1 Tax=Notodromas monacha TaxID=399045 RepID=A0A7R9BQV8_9CRUS|nr:unnamed protein product [Notodromas monacha]CAG0919684.1 unnamed protein product [Notodromas monacha]
MKSSGCGVDPRSGDASVKTSKKRPYFSALMLVVGLTGVKMLCMPLYRSTDFEVHRNWMAITHSLPISEWYRENRSEWTLDYPPLFAWFEYGLSVPAKMVDEKMVDVDAMNHASNSTVAFMRGSVMATDVLFAVGAFFCAVAAVPMSSLGFSESVMMTTALLFADVNLFIVDHLHFQYNGFLNGVLFLSIYCLMSGKPFWGAFLFAVLLNLKHIYLYIAPAFFCYLLRTECFASPVKRSAKTKNTKEKSDEPDSFVRFLKSFNVEAFLTLGLIVSSVFAVSLGPFFATGQGEQLKERLFPFKRGLTHAYWAPNFWALYNTVDKAVSWHEQHFQSLMSEKPEMSLNFPAWNPGRSAKRHPSSQAKRMKSRENPRSSYNALTRWFQFLIGVSKLHEAHLCSDDDLSSEPEEESHEKLSSSTSGLVEEFDHEFLPSVTPATTFALTAPFILIALIPVLKDPVWPKFVESVVLCAWASFLFGWHVHEKAILMITLPMALLAAGNSRAAKIYWFLNAIATLSLFPLLFTPMENVLKFFLWGVSVSMNYVILEEIHGWGRCDEAGKKRWEWSDVFDFAFLLGAVGVAFYYSLLHGYLFEDRMEFLPLMLVSAYCAVGVIYSYIRFLIFALW